jgi:outer membrane protein TolC
MKSYIIIILLVLLSPIVVAQDSLSIEEAIEKALRRNHNIQVAKIQAEISESNVFIGNAGMLPKLDVVGGQNYSNQISDLEFAGGIPPITDTRAISAGTNAGLRMTYTLFDGFGMFRSYEQLKNQSSLTALQSKLNIESTLMQTISIYLQLLEVQQQVSIQEAVLNISKDRLKRVETRGEFGSASKIEVLNAKVDYYNDSAALMRIQQNEANQRRRLAFYLGDSLDVKYSLKMVDSNIEIVNQDSLLAAAKNNHGSVLLSQMQLEIEEMDKKLVQSRMLPRVSADLQYGYNRSDNNAGVLLKSEAIGFTGNLSLSWNLFDGMRQQRALQTASLSINQAQEKKLQALAQVELEMRNAVENFKMTQSIYQLEIQNVKTSRLNLERSQVLYYNGQLTSLEYRRAQINLKSAQLNQLSALTEMYQYYVEVLRLSDRLFQF